MAEGNMARLGRHGNNGHHRSWRKFSTRLLSDPRSNTLTQVYEAHPAHSRSFPVYFQDGEIVYPQFAYPMRNEIVPIWAAALLGSLVPISVILICQIRIRSFWNVNNAVIGLLYSLITAAIF